MKKIYVCTLAVFLSFGVLFYFILTILLPFTYRRSFTVLTSGGENYVLECYVPGSARHAIVTNDSGKARITYSEKGNGTLVKIETRSCPGFLNILNVSIWFAPENDEELLTSSPSITSYFADSDESESYSIMANGEPAAALGAYDTISEGKAGALYAALFLLIGRGICIGGVLLWTRRKKNKNLSYSLLTDMAKAYLTKYVYNSISPDKKTQMENRMKRYVFLQSSVLSLTVLAVLSVPLWLDLSVQFWSFIGFLVFIFAAGFILSKILNLSLNSSVSVIRLTGKTAPEIWQHRYRLHDLDEGCGTIWGLTDLTMAEAMTLMGHPEESYAFAENIWKEFGWNLTLGKWYGLYHFIQWMNCTMTGREEEGKTHRENAEKEFRRKPKNALYQRLMKTAESMK